MTQERDELLDHIDAVGVPGDEVNIPGPESPLPEPDGEEDGE
jgi:hypothetical protein